MPDRLEALPAPEPDPAPTYLTGGDIGYAVTIVNGDLRIFVTSLEERTVHQPCEEMEAIRVLHDLAMGLLHNSSKLHYDYRNLVERVQRRQREDIGL
jgi:predicted RecB family endonuclease